MSHLRCWAVGCVTVLIVGGLAADLVAAEPDLTAARRVAREAETKLLAGLHKSVKAEWSNVPVEQVLETLAKTAGVNLWIDREALAADGISLQDSLVDLHLGEATVWQALTFVLKPLSVLEWRGTDGVLTITTQVRADEIQFQRTYDVQAIVAALEPQLKNLPPPDLTSIGSWTRGGGGGQGAGGGRGGAGGGGFFRVPEDAETVPVPTFILPQFGDGGFGQADPFEQGILIRRPSISVRGEDVLARLLMESFTGRAKWEATHGEGGTISIGRGRLIVRQNYQTHFQIRELLLALEEFVVRGSKAKSILVNRPGYPHDEDAAIFKRLAEPEDIDVNDATLVEALAQLAKAGRYRFWLDRESLAADGIATDQLVTLKLSGTTRDTVLHKLLEPLMLTFVVEEGTLIVTTMVKADEIQSLRVYFTGDIPEARSSSDLLTAIQEATSGKWEQVDGEGGAMSKVVPEWLVIRQHQACHREIAELLDDLRQAAVAPVAVAAPEFEVRLYPVADASALQDLIGSLPKLIPAWDAKDGSIVVLGQSLAIKQSVLVHERLDEIFSALNQAAARLNLPKPKEEPKPAPAAK